MWSKIKAFLGTAALTLLIWLAADQNVSDSQTIEIPVRLTVQNGFAVIRKPGPETVFKVTVVGRRRRVMEFRELLEKQRPNAFEAVVSQGQQFSSEPQIISSDVILGWVREVANASLSRQDVSPPTVTVLIDRYETIRNVTVVPKYGEFKIIEPVCVPPSVDARVPTVRPDAEPFIREKRQESPESTSFQVDVPLVSFVEQGVPIEFIPSKATISGVVETVTSTQRIGPVQILLLVPDEVQRRYTVEVDAASNLRPDIFVIGPERMLQQLDARDVRGFVEVRASDMERAGKEITRDAVFILPAELPGLKLETSAQPHPITFRLNPRAAEDGITG
jgi:hypothetical protein